ncbi:MerR family transcriptional regulator [Vibrio galatheae]|uniref:MerR family transcriptional regulator n=1 Tax=Vibrio galatheae TaxID=579748 RepID=A0A0F4NKB7_9VIBR|nr:MerR family transcriptional regulator [Vibrio galatheae]KJY83323.1 MerR family transcriptional regulator [Vibrio galatheae]
MNIKDFSKLVGLSPHTLRYYEKIGLLKSVQRSQSGHRFYTSRDKEWIDFVKRLKETGMPLEGILTYAKLRELGCDTLLERQQLLEQHRAFLSSHIQELEQHMLALDDKIALYQSGKVS